MDAMSHLVKGDETIMPGEKELVEVVIERVLGQGCSAVPWPSCQPSNASITIGKAPRKIG